MPRQRTFDLTLPDPPEVVRARLRAATCFRPIPHTAPAFRWGTAPLGGWFTPSGFRVSMTDPDRWTRLQAVAVGTLEATGGGTRVHGVAGLPTGITWGLRLSFFVALLVPWIWTALAAAEGASPGVTASVAVFGVTAVLLLAIGALGASVAHADAGVDALIARVEALARGAAPPETTGTAQEARRPLPARQRDGA